MTRTLSDTEALALILAAPVDPDADIDTKPAARQVDYEEHRDAAWQFKMAQESPTRYQERLGASPATRARNLAVLARVYGLPSRALNDIEPVTLSLAWESEPDIARMAGAQDRISAALEPLGLPETLGTIGRIEAACAELLRLRKYAADIGRALAG